jgi:hypothetical protein
VLNRLPGVTGNGTATTRALIERRHPEWTEHQVRWRWLLDSLEGGNRYRDAVYGVDRHGIPIRNLVRHKREYPDPRDVSADTARWAIDSWQSATDDDYELRRARTPVPTFVAEASDAHLGRIYRGEIEREGPDLLKEWWGNVDGKGSSVDTWMQDAVAAIMLVTGQVDILIDHPSPPDGEVVTTKADVLRLGLSDAIASYILPENMVWWTLNRDGSYRECLVREADEHKPNEYRFRYWTETGSTLLGRNGEVISERPHAFGRVPIIRVFARKKPRCCNVGMSRYEGIAERQREFYNRDSELILSDTTQAHPLLQGPEDYVQGDGTIPIGPSWLLPKKKSNSGGSTSYEGFDVVEFPKDGAESIRANLDRLRDDVDRDAHLTKPPGTNGAGTVGQSGVSKRLDSQTANDVLGRIAAALQHAERQIACLAWCVLNDGKVTPADEESIGICYPREYDLFNATELGTAIADFQATLAASGGAPETEGTLLCRLVRLMLPGLEDDEYEEIEAEIELAVQTAATRRSMTAESMMTTGTSGQPAEGDTSTPMMDGESEGMTDASQSESES